MRHHKKSGCGQGLNKKRGVLFMLVNFLRKHHFIFLGILLLVLSVTLVGCGSSKEQKTDNTAAPTTTDKTAETPKTGNFALDYVPTKTSGFTLGFSNGYLGNAWRAQFIEDIEKACDEYKKQGILKDAIIVSTNGVPDQIATLENMINSGVDAICVNPCSSTALAPVVAKAISKGILVVVVDDPAEYPNVINVAGDAVEQTKMYAKWFIEQLGGKGNIVNIQAIAGNSLSELRNSTSMEIFKNYPDIKILGTDYGNWDYSKCQQIMSQFLTAFPNQIDGVYSGDCTAVGVVQAYKAANKPIPIHVADYPYQYLRMWKKDFPQYNQVIFPYTPGIGVDGIKVTLKLLQGYKLKLESLEANQMKPELKNTIVCYFPLLVTKDGTTGKWFDDYKAKDNTEVVSLDEILKRGEGLPDQAIPDKIWSDEFVDSLFQPKQ